MHDHVANVDMVGQVLYVSCYSLVRMCHLDGTLLKKRDSDNQGSKYIIKHAPSMNQARELELDSCEENKSSHERMQLAMSWT